MIRDTDWLEQAACKGTPITLWCWGPGVDRPPARAVELCAACPVRRECLQDALSTRHSDDEHGYRAGTTPADRRRIRRKQPRNRAA